MKQHKIGKAIRHIVIRTSILTIAENMSNMYTFKLTKSNPNIVFEDPGHNSEENTHD